MGAAGSRSAIAGGGQPAAGADVVVPMETAAPAAPAAPPAAAGARSVWTWVCCIMDVTWTRAAAPPASTGAAGPGRALVAAALARAPPAALAALTARLALAAALFLLGCAAAGLALFTMVLSPTDSHLLLGTCAPPTDAEMANLRRAAEYLLLAASAQVVAATMGLLVPARLVAAFGNLVGLLTGYRAMVVFWTMLVAAFGNLVGLLTGYRAMVVFWTMLVACHGSVHGALAFYFWLFYVMLLSAFSVCAFVSLR